jgi:tetrahydromethanopterin:alpha-L-glutamate ligase
MVPRVTLAADNGEWHRARLLAAFHARGVKPVLFSLADVAIDTGGGEPLRLPGFEDSLPDGVLLRTLSGGTFEATTLRLSVLHALEQAGVVVWNAPKAIERCVDKGMTSLLLARAGLPTPETAVVSTREAAGEVVARHAAEGRPTVLKPLFGSQGKGLRLLARPEDLPEPDEVARVYYLQRYRPRPDGIWRDFRVFVCAGRAVTGMIREGDGWITNLHQGGRPSPWAVPPRAASLAVAAAEVVGVAFTGVDLIESEDGGFEILELNSMPSWSGLQGVTDQDIAAAIVDGFLAAMRAARRPDLAAAPGEAAPDLLATG